MCVLVQIVIRKRVAVGPLPKEAAPREAKGLGGLLLVVSGGVHLFHLVWLICVLVQPLWRHCPCLRLQVAASSAASRGLAAMTQLRGPG